MDGTTQQHPQQMEPTTINRSVMEVTDASGKVGFVAVGRRYNTYSSPPRGAPIQTSANISPTSVLMSDLQISNDTDQSAMQHDRSSTPVSNNTAVNSVDSPPREVQQPSTSQHSQPTHYNQVETSPSINSCKQCGQVHRTSENHEYNYLDDPDEDLTCDICLMPFIHPYDTRCGHTFCELCLKNHIKLKKSCPVDRQDLSLSSSDIWESSQVLCKLVNKLQITCPNTSYCNKTLSRGDLSQHLVDKCPGTMLRCEKSIFGCDYRGPRQKLSEHHSTCRYNHIQAKPLEMMYPGYKKHTIEICRKDASVYLGLFIVGGCDTSLKAITVQNIMADSIVGRDGRILPGDIIVQVNNEKLYNVQHVEARLVLSRANKLIRFTIMRYDPTYVSPTSPTLQQHNTATTTTTRSNGGGIPASDNHYYYDYDVFNVTLLKPPSTQLGIKITACEDEEGIYILEMLKNKVASLSGELKVGDRILSISGVDMTHSTPDCAALVIMESEERVNFVISRARPKHQQKYMRGASASSGGTSSPYHHSSRHHHHHNNHYHHDNAQQPYSPPRTNGIERSKSIVRRPAPPPPNANMSSQPPHYGSMTSLSNTMTSSSNQLTNGAAAGANTSFTIFKEIRLTKRLQENLGIVVAGGVAADSASNLPIFIRDILSNGIMQRDKRLKKGDVLISVNNSSLVGLTHAQAVTLLKDVAYSCKEAVFMTCQLEYPNKEADFAIWDESNSIHHMIMNNRGKNKNNKLSNSGTPAASPSWRMWLTLPIKFHYKREVVIKLPPNQPPQDFGIRICMDSTSHDSLCIIKNIIPGSPASRHPANLESGDVIIEINQHKIAAGGSTLSAGQVPGGGNQHQNSSSNPSNMKNKMNSPLAFLQKLMTSHHVLVITVVQIQGSLH